MDVPHQNLVRPAASEFQIFKGRYLLAQGREIQDDGKCLNPVRHGEVIRQAFVDAQPREKELCSKLSRWHGVVSEDAKALGRAVEECEHGVAGAAASNEMLAIEWRVGEMKASPVDQSRVVYRGVEENRSLVEGSIVSAPARVEICNALVPWTHQHLDDYRVGRGLFEGKGPRKKMEAQNELKRMTSPSTSAEAPAFPSKVDKPPCGCMCANSSHPAHLSFYKRIKTALACIASTSAPKAKAALISSTDCLIAIDGAGRATAFYRLSDAKARHAQHEAVQELIALDPQPRNALSPWVGVQITASRSAFIPPAPDHFDQNIFAESAYGDHVAITGDRLASNLAHIKKVDISVLYAMPMRLDSLDCWTVGGVKRTFQLGDTTNPAPKLGSDVAGLDEDISEEGFGELPSAFDNSSGICMGERIDDEVDPLEAMLASILEGEIADGLSLLDLNRQEAFASATEAADEMELDAEHDRAISGGGSSSSGVATSSNIVELPPKALGAPADIDSFIENACRVLQLDRRHGAGLFSFADSCSPLRNILVIHKVRTTLRATCKARSHGSCKLWLSTDVTDPATFLRVLLALMRWGAAGRDAGEHEHFRLNLAVKREFGMDV